MLRVGQIEYLSCIILRSKLTGLAFRSDSILRIGINILTETGDQIEHFILVPFVVGLTCRLSL